MNRTVNRLEEAGYVERTADAADGRKVVVVPTDRGAGLVAETRRRRDAWLHQRLAHAQRRRARHPRRGRPDHAGARRLVSAMFRSLAGVNYRIWAGGAIVSNVGTWMQRTAQDWIVLTQLTHNNATAVGFVMALQFGPQLLLLPVTGWAADHLDRRKLLMATQAAMGAARARARHPDRHRRGAALARLRVRAAARRRRGLRRARAPDVRLRARRRPEPVQRGGAQLGVVQRRPPDRTGGRRPADRPRSAPGWVFLINAATFGAVLAVAALCSGASSCTARSAPSGRAAASSTASATCASGPDIMVILVDGVPDRNLRPQLPDLHLDHVGERVPPGRGRVRPPVVDHGDRLGGRRAALGAARPRRASRCCSPERRSSASAAHWPRSCPPTGCSRSR